MSGSLRSVTIILLALIWLSAEAHFAMASESGRCGKQGSQSETVETVSGEIAGSESISGEPGGATKALKEAQAQVPAMPSYPDPNKIPYRTGKSLLVHFFSIPAKIWHLAWTPLGATVIWMDQNRIPQKLTDFFYLNDERTAAIFPLVSLGGSTGAGGGLMAFHNNLFGNGEKLLAQGLYSSTGNNSASVAFLDSTFLGTQLFFDMTGLYFNDSDENLYVSSDRTTGDLNNSNLDANHSSKADETSYATEEYGVFGTLGYAFSPKVSLGVISSFKRADVDSGDGAGGNKFRSDIPGAGATKLFTIGGSLTLNFTNGWPRVLSGSLLRTSYAYTTEVDGSRFAYNRFTVEAAQFFPVPFLAKHRTLAIRGMFEKLDRIGSKQIPFYELSTLGNAANLRAFDQNRFRGRGLLLFNFEYRYPVWDTWDAVIFVDEGQVYDDLGDISLDNFHTAIGTGLRFMSPAGFLMRFEIARGSEQWRVLFQISPNFPNFSFRRESLR